LQLRGLTTPSSIASTGRAPSKREVARGALALAKQSEILVEQVNIRAWESKIPRA
jgi:hypothetical protein